MYGPHQSFTAPNPDARIWRYLSLPKFIDMLERSALWFTQLEQMPDPFEGVPEDAVLEDERALAETLRTILRDRTGMSAEAAQRWGPELPHQSGRRIMYVNCWHLNDYESMAMWQIYSREGIAIRSTFQHFVDSLQNVEESIFIGKVNYRDRRVAKHARARKYTFDPALRKGMSYEHERELRAITLRAPDYADATDEPVYVPGINVHSVDLDTLIDAVYVAPGCPTWVKELVQRIMDRYEFKKPLESSDLDARPELT
jgi:hypothetical protein